VNLYGHKDWRSEVDDGSKNDWGKFAFRFPDDPEGQNRTPNPASLQDWTEEIKKVWARDAASTLDLARVMSAAKTRLYYGQWSQLWKSAQMPFSKSTADRLAVIGQRMGGLDSATSLNLPRGWNILYCLARLDQGSLKRLIQQGLVHLKLTLRQAKELVAQSAEMRTQSGARKTDVRERLRRFANFVAAHLRGWSTEERQLVTKALTGLIQQIAAADGGVFERNGNSRILVTQRGILADQGTNL